MTKTIYESKLNALFNENNEYKRHKGEANSKAMNHRLKLNKNLKMIEKMVKDCKCHALIDKNIEEIAIEGENPQIVKQCVDTLNVLYGFTETEHITLADNSTITYIRKKAPKEELVN